MTLVLALLGGLVGLALLWLGRQGVLSKPWLDGGVIAAPEARLDASRLGLRVLLVVIGALFGLFGSAFVMRMEPEAWSGLALPGIVWPNTALLAGASLFLHGAARRREGAGLRRHAALAGLATLAFLAGQLVAWRELSAAGRGLASGPAASFFYLLSGLHGLHVLGGLMALGLVLARRAGGVGVGLCATYWDFLLIVWLGLLVLLAGWANQVVAICRGVLT